MDPSGEEAVHMVHADEGHAMVGDEAYHTEQKESVGPEGGGVEEEEGGRLDGGGGGGRWG